MSHSAPCVEQGAPDTSVVAHGGKPDEVPPLPGTGTRQTGGPQVGYHFRSPELPPVPLVPPVPEVPPVPLGHGGNEVVHWPLSQTPVAQVKPPLGHALQICGTAQSAPLEHPPFDPPVAGEPPEPTEPPAPETPPLPDEHVLIPATH